MVRKIIRLIEKRQMAVTGDAFVQNTVHEQNDRWLKVDLPLQFSPTTSHFASIWLAFCIYLIRRTFNHVASENVWRSIKHAVWQVYSFHIIKTVWRNYTYNYHKFRPNVRRRLSSCVSILFTTLPRGIIVGSRWMDERLLKLTVMSEQTSGNQY